MKRKIMIHTSCTAAALMLTSVAWAAEPQTSDVPTDYKAASSATSKANTSNYGRTSKASLLMGKNVKNMKGETVGEVADLVVDLAAGRVVAVAISSGGFLGIGDELSIVPPAAFRFAEGTDELQLDVTKEALSNAPHFKAGEWPDLSKAGYISSVYSAYKVKNYMDHSDNAERNYSGPANSERGNRDPENTGRNSSDRDNSERTALDQGNSRADIDVTAQIRKDIMAQDGLSMNAQNVKIITSDGRVTLRGPVDSAEEKRVIRELAIKASGKETIDDQLEVK